MKIAILSRKKTIHSTERLVQSCLEKGHEAHVIDPLKCYMNITTNKPLIYYKDKTLQDYDAIIPRIGSSVTFYGTAVLRQFELQQTFSLNSSISIVRSRDKLRAHQLLSQKDIGMPMTGFAHSPVNIKNLIEIVGGTPLVIKLLEGTQGKGVILAETRKAAESVIDAFRNLNAFFLVQEFIKEANGSDIRCFVIGDKVVAAMQRQAQAGDFRSNIHRGGTAVAVKITPKERKTAVNAAKALGLNVAGVDLIRSDRGPLVLEVNSSPGLEGIERATGKNIGKLIIEFVEKNYQTKKRKFVEKGK